MISGQPGLRNTISTDSNDQPIKNPKLVHAVVWKRNALRISWGFENSDGFAEWMQYLTDPFTILELQNQEIGLFCVAREHRVKNVEAEKLSKGRLGTGENKHPTDPFTNFKI